MTVTTGGNLDPVAEFGVGDQQPFSLGLERDNLKDISISVRFI